MTYLVPIYKGSPWNDPNKHDISIREVHGPYDGTQYTIKTDVGITGINTGTTGIVPKPGDVLHLWTEGGVFGVRHGAGINRVILDYKPYWEQYAYNIAMIAVNRAEKYVKWKWDHAKQDEAYNALPPLFQRRVDKFRHTRLDFRANFENYEVATCTLAARIVEHCPTPEAITTFKNKSIAQQIATLGDCADVSGNMTDCAFCLAYYALIDPRLVILAHGAMSALATCEEYGCPHPVPGEMIENLP